MKEDAATYRISIQVEITLKVSFLVSFDKSHINTPSGACSFAFKTVFSYIFEFRVSAKLVYTDCEFIWAIRLSAATFVAPYCDMISPFLEFTTVLWGALLA
jgi:hypothetical protein